MASRSRRRTPTHGKGTPPRQNVAGAAPEATGLRPRLQILAGFLLPLLVLGLWLNSRGFWSP
ncbi:MULTISPECIES: hypothetical protein [unclassified Synechococcus]|uniref:hypothetical protein n=1 Tax=unclassified Synechococcus TaxID=2626047 RepID=UPI000B98565D|nr:MULTISPECIES: hypothetical protein [unclassified Synechococcus]MBD2718091.1 hypothetical protein [Synechococcus sp. FACHB-909]